MNKNLAKIYDEENDILGYPQIYKNIKFFPLKLLGEKKYKQTFDKLFCYPKNTIADKQIIKMSYLKFILFVMQSQINPGGLELKSELEDFFKHVCRTDEVYVLFADTKSFDSINTINLKLNISGIDFSEKEFDNVREIVLQQNGLSIEYINQYDASLEDKLAFINRGFSDITFVENVFIFCSMANFKISDLKDYTLYQFKEHSRRLSLWKNYEMFKPVEIINKTKDDKDWVENYLKHIDKNDRYAGLLIRTKEFADKNPAFGENGELKMGGIPKIQHNTRKPRMSKKNHK